MILEGLIGLAETMALAVGVTMEELSLTVRQENLLTMN
jgi:hypothetical protein